MELTTLNLILILIAQALVSLAMTIGLIALAMRGSRKLQDRLLFHSKALNRFAKYVLSDNYQNAMREKARDAVLQELNADLAEQALQMEQREQALQLANEELQRQQQQLAETLAAQPASATADNADLLTEDEELAAMEQELESHQSAEQSSALLAEIAELRSSLDKQNAELARLRAQVSMQDANADVVELVDVQRKQLEQYQRMQRDMDMCVQVMEQELAQSRNNLQRALVKLRQQTERNIMLSARLTKALSSS